VIQRTKYPINP